MATPAGLSDASAAANTATSGPPRWRLTSGRRQAHRVAILEGEVAAGRDGAEVIRHGAPVLVENLLSGQTVFLSDGHEAHALHRRRPRRAARAVEDASLADRDFMSRRELLQQRQGVGGDREPGLSATDPREGGVGQAQPAAAQLARSRAPTIPRSGSGRGLEPDQLRWCGSPAGMCSIRPTGSFRGRRQRPGAPAREEVDPGHRSRPAGPAPRSTAPPKASNARREHRSRRSGRLVTADREYLGFPAGITGNELTSRAVTQARKFNARTATPNRALALEPGAERHVVKPKAAARSLHGPWCWPAELNRRLPVAGSRSTRASASSTPPGRPRPRCGATRVGVVGGGNSAGRPPRLARGGALVTLLHRRGDLSETMSDTDRRARGTGCRCATEARSPSCTVRTASSRRRCADGNACPSPSSSVPGCAPCTDWLGARSLAMPTASCRSRSGR